MILQNTALRFLKRQRKLRLKVGNVYRMFLNMYYDKSFADKSFADWGLKITRFGFNT